MLKENSQTFSPRSYRCCSGDCVFGAPRNRRIFGHEKTRPLHKSHLCAQRHVLSHFETKLMIVLYIVGRTWTLISLCFDVHIGKPILRVPHFRVGLQKRVGAPKTQPTKFTPNPHPPFSLSLLLVHIFVVVFLLVNIFFFVVVVVVVLLALALVHNFVLVLILVILVLVVLVILVLVVLVILLV